MEKYDGYFNKQYAGFDCEEHYLGSTNGYAGIKSIADVWFDEPNSSKSRSTDKIDKIKVEAYVDCEYACIRMGTEEELSKGSNRNNCWTLKILKYD